MTIVGFILNKKSYIHKKAIGYSFAPSDIEWKWGVAVKLASISILGGLLGGGLGLGSGLVINPLLISTTPTLPVVASGTGMYMV